MVSDHGEQEHYYGYSVKLVLVKLNFIKIPRNLFDTSPTDLGTC